MFEKKNVFLHLKIIIFNKNEKNKEKYSKKIKKRSIERLNSQYGNKK